MHDLLNRWKREWASAKISVQHAEIGYKMDLIVFLRNSKSLGCPFRVVVVAEHADFAEVFDFCLEERKEQTGDLVCLAMIGLDIGICKLKMDGFARKFSKLAGEKEGMLLEDMPKGTALRSVKVSRDHVFDLQFVIIRG